MLNQGRSGDLDDHVVDADLQIGIERVDTAAHFGGAIHLDVGGEKEMRHRAERRNEPLGNRLANLRGGLVAISGCCRDRRWWKLCRLDHARILRRRRGFGLTECGFDVSLDDSSAWSTALHRT